MEDLLLRPLSIGHPRFADESRHRHARFHCVASLRTKEPFMRTNYARIERQEGRNPGREKHARIEVVLEPPSAEQFGQWRKIPSPGKSARETEVVPSTPSQSPRLSQTGKRQPPQTELRPWTGRGRTCSTPAWRRRGPPTGRLVQHRPQSSRHLRWRGRVPRTQQRCSLRSVTGKGEVVAPKTVTAEKRGDDRFQLEIRDEVEQAFVADRLAVFVQRDQLA